jgi:hypothetical protein
MKELTPTNQALKSQISLMEAFACDLFDNTQRALEDISQNNGDAAIGGLMAVSENLDGYKTLFDSAITIHRNSALLDGPEL